MKYTFPYTLVVAIGRGRLLRVATLTLVSMGVIPFYHYYCISGYLSEKLKSIVLSVEKMRFIHAAIEKHCANILQGKGIFLHLKFTTLKSHLK